MVRPKTLKFLPAYRDSGDGRGPQPKAYHQGIPARDLDEADIAALSDAELATATGGSDPLYVEPKQEARHEPRTEDKADEKPVKGP